MVLQNEKYRKGRNDICSKAFGPQRKIVVVKDKQSYVFKYYKGQEAIVIEECERLASVAGSGFSSLDAFIISSGLGKI